LIEPVELPFDGVPRVDKAEVPVEPTGESLTRRQLRELEKTGGVLAIHTSQIQLPPLPAEESAVAEEPAVAEVPQPDEVVAEREEPLTVANPVISVPEETVVEQAFEQVVEPAPEPTPAPAPLGDDSARAAAAARAAQVANEFEAILSGALSGATTKPRKSARFKLILTTSILLVVVGGLFIAASVMGILK
ncbi:MAG: hypothetical protein RLZZ443_328, partial [Actinomycetota bacterium]